MSVACNNCGSRLEFVPLPSDNVPFECYNCNNKLNELDKLQIILEYFDCIDYKKLEDIDKGGLMDPLEHSRDTTKQVHWRLKNKQQIQEV